MNEIKITLRPIHLAELNNGRELKAYSKSGDWLFVIVPPAVHGEPAVAELDVEEV